MEVILTVIVSTVGSIMAALLAASSPPGKAIVLRWQIQVSHGIRPTNLGATFFVAARLPREWWWLRNQKLDYTLSVEQVASGRWPRVRRGDACVTLFPEHLHWDLIVIRNGENRASVHVPQVHGVAADSAIELTESGEYLIELRLSRAFLTIYSASLQVTID